MPTRNLCRKYINDWGDCQTNKAVGNGSFWMKGHCEAFFAEAILLFNGDCPAVRDTVKRHFVVSLLAMTLFFKRPHYQAVRLTPKTTTPPLLKRINSLIILTDYSRSWGTCVFYLNYRAKVG